MDIHVRQESAATLHEYARVPIAFDVLEAFDVTAAAGDQFRLAARRVASPYVKDYDAISESPTEWAQRFDIAHWAFFGAFADGPLHGCRHLKVETQSINVTACRFYARQGFVLRSARSGVYPELKGEIQLLWYKDLGDG